MPTSADLPTVEEIDLALARVRDSLGTHIAWADYRRAGGDESPGCGDAEFHAQCIAEYTQVIDVLERVRAAAGRSLCLCVSVLNP